MTTPQDTATARFDGHTPEDPCMAAAWAIWKAEVAAGSPTSQTLTEIAAKIREHCAAAPALLAERDELAAQVATLRAYLDQAVRTIQAGGSLPRNGSWVGGARAALNGGAK